MRALWSDRPNCSHNVSQNQKKRGVHKISARNSGAGNGCANFMGAWHFLVLSAGKPPLPIKFRLLGGGFWVFLEGGGWKCQFYFYGRGDFSDKKLNVSGASLKKGCVPSQRAL